MNRISTKHTPGPWHLVFTGPASTPDWIVEAGEIVIARIEVTTTRTAYEVGRNARLIAAAPEMLEALEEILRNVSPWERADTMAGRLGGIARAAIAKAEGRTL